MEQALRRLQPLLRAMSTTATSSLSKFSTCEISDALVKLGVPHGGHIPDIHVLSPAPHVAQDTRICGPAYTVQLVLGSDTSAPKLSSHFVDTAPAGSVIVIAAPPRSVCSPLLSALFPLRFARFRVSLIHWHVLEHVLQRTKMLCGAAS